MGPGPVLFSIRVTVGSTFNVLNIILNIILFSRPIIWSHLKPRGGPGVRGRGVIVSLTLTK